MREEKERERFLERQCLAAQNAELHLSGNIDKEQQKEQQRR